MVSTLWLFAHVAAFVLVVHHLNGPWMQTISAYDDGWSWGVHVQHGPSVPAREGEWQRSNKSQVARYATADGVPQRTVVEPWQLRPVLQRHSSPAPFDSVIKSPDGMFFRDNRGRRSSSVGSSSGSLYRLGHGFALQWLLLLPTAAASDLGPMPTLVFSFVMTASLLDDWVAQCMIVSKHQGMGSSETAAAVEQHKIGRLVAQLAPLAASLLATYLVRSNIISCHSTDTSHVLLQYWSMPWVLAVAAALLCQAQHTFTGLLLGALLLLLGGATTPNRTLSAQHVWMPLSMMMMLPAALLQLIFECLNWWLSHRFRWRSLHNSSNHGRPAAVYTTPAPVNDQVETATNKQNHSGTTTSRSTSPVSAQEASPQQRRQQQQPLGLVSALQDEARLQLQQCPARGAATAHPAAHLTPGASARHNVTAVQAYGSTAAAVSSTGSLHCSSVSMLATTATDGTGTTSSYTASVQVPTTAATPLAATPLAAPKAAMAEACLCDADVSDACASKTATKPVNKTPMYQSTLRHHMLSIKVEMLDTHDSCDFVRSLMQQLSKTTLGLAATATPPPAAAAGAAPVVLMSNPLVVRGCFHILLSVATPAAAAKGVEGVLSSTGVRELIDQLPAGSKVKMLSQHADLAVDTAAAAVHISSGTGDMMLVQINQQQPVLVTKQLGCSWKVREHGNTAVGTNGGVLASQHSTSGGVNTVTGCWVEAPYVMLPQTTASAAAGAPNGSSSGSGKLTVVAHGLPAAAGPAVRALIVQGERVLADVTVQMDEDSSSRHDSDSKALVARIELPSDKMLPGPAQLYLMSPSTHSSNTTAAATAAARRGPLAASRVAKDSAAATTGDLGSAVATAFINARMWACLPFLVTASQAAAADFDTLFNNMCAKTQTQQRLAATPSAASSSIDSVVAHVYQQHWQPMLWDWHYAVYARDISCAESISAMADVLTQHPALTAADVGRIPGPSSSAGKDIAAAGKDTASAECKDIGGALTAARRELGGGVLQVLTDCGLHQAALELERQLGKLLAGNCRGSPSSLAEGSKVSAAGSDRQLLGVSAFGASRSKHASGTGATGSAVIGTTGSSSSRVSEHVQPLSALPKVFCSQQQPPQQVIPEFRSRSSSSCSDPFMNRSFSIINSAELEAVRAVNNPDPNPVVALNPTAGVRSLQFTSHGSMPVPRQTMYSPLPRSASAAAAPAAAASPGGFSGIQDQMSLLGLTSPLRSGQQMQMHRMQLQAGNAFCATPPGGAMLPGSLPPFGSSSASRPVLLFVDYDSLAYEVPQQQLGAAHAVHRRSYDVPSQLMDMQRRMSLEVPRHLTARPLTAAAAPANPTQVAAAPSLTPAAAVLAGQAATAGDAARTSNAVAATGAAAGAATALLPHHAAAADNARAAFCPLPPQSIDSKPAAPGDGNNDSLAQRDAVSSSTSSSAFFTAANNLLTNFTTDTFSQDLTDIIPLEQGLPGPNVDPDAQQDQQPSTAPAAAATPPAEHVITHSGAKGTAQHDKPQVTASLTTPAKPTVAAAAKAWTQQQGAGAVASTTGHTAAAASPCTSSSVGGSGASPPAGGGGSDDHRWHLVYDTADDTAGLHSPEPLRTDNYTSRLHTTTVNSTAWFAIPTSSAATLLPPPTPGAPSHRSGALYSVTRNTPYTPGPSARKKRTHGHSSSSGYHAGFSGNVSRGIFSDDHTVSHGWGGGHHTPGTAGKLLTPQQTAAAAAAHSRTPNTVGKDGTPRDSAAQHSGLPTATAAAADEHSTLSPDTTQSRPQRKLMLFSPVRNTGASRAERKAADSLENLGALGLQQQNTVVAFASTAAGSAVDTAAVASTVTLAAPTAVGSLVEQFSSLGLKGPSTTSSKVHAPPAAAPSPAVCRVPRNGGLANVPTQPSTAMTPARPPLPAAAATPAAFATPQRAAVPVWAAGNTSARPAALAAGYSTPGRRPVGSSTPKRRQTPASPMAAPGMFESWASNLLTPKNRNRDTVCGVLELLSGQKSPAGADEATDNKPTAQGSGLCSRVGPRAGALSPDSSDDEEIGPSRFHLASATPCRTPAGCVTAASIAQLQPQIGFFTGGSASASHSQLPTPSKARFAFSPYVPKPSPYVAKPSPYVPKPSPYVPKPSPYVAKPSPYVPGTTGKPMGAMPRIPSSPFGQSVELIMSDDESPESPITQAGRRITGALFAPDGEAIAAGLGLTGISNVLSGGNSISGITQHGTWHKPVAGLGPSAVSGAAASGYSTPPSSPPVVSTMMNHHVTGLPTSSQSQQVPMQSAWPGTGAATMLVPDPDSYSTPVGSPSDATPLGTPPGQIMCSLDNLFHTALPAAVYEAGSPSGQIQDLETPVQAGRGHALTTIKESPGGNLGAYLSVPNPKTSLLSPSNPGLRNRATSSPSLLGLQRTADDIFKGLSSIENPDPSSSAAGASPGSNLKPRRASAPEMQLTPPPAPARPLPSVVLVPACEIAVSEALLSAEYYDSEYDAGEWFEDEEE